MTYFLWSQTFRFMVGPGHCPMISKYGPSLSKAVGPVDPSFLVVKNLTLIKNKNVYLTASHAYKCLCQCVGKAYYPNVNCD